MSLLNLYYIVHCTKRFRGCLLRREQLLFLEPITNTTIRSPLWSVWVWNNTKSIVLPHFNPRNQQCRTFSTRMPLWTPLFQKKPTDNVHWVHWVLIVYNGATCPSWYSDTFLGPIFQYLQHHAQNFSFLLALDISRCVVNLQFDLQWPFRACVDIVLSGLGPSASLGF